MNCRPPRERRALGAAARRRGTGRACALAWANLSTIWLLLPVVVVFVVGNLLQVMPHDFWWHVRTGQIILTSHSVPAVDSFTFTRSGFPWTNEAWLMQVILYLLYAAGGLPLAIFAVALNRGRRLRPN